MTPEDADKLREQVERLDDNQLLLLIKWLTKLWFYRMKVKQ
jgi:hypothetical protein